MLPQEALLLWKIYTEQVLFYFAHSKVFSVYRKNITPALHKLRTPHYVHILQTHNTQFHFTKWFIHIMSRVQLRKKKRLTRAYKNKSVLIFGVRVLSPTCTLTHPRSTKKALPQSHSHKQNLSALLYCTSYPRMIKYGLKMPTRPRRGRTWLLFFTIPPVSSSDCMPLVPLKLRIINIQW